MEMEDDILRTYPVGTLGSPWGLPGAHVLMAQ